MFDSSDSINIATHLGSAVLAGGLIGLERSYHGRAAGFRTHVLVCVSSALLMLVTLYQAQWFPQSATWKVASDPTRMAQGIMTGIGFLGAGVIMKEGLTVRGLTTAASIWITAAIGILAGIGFYEPVIMGTLLTLAALAVFRWLETIIPAYSYAYLDVSFSIDDVLNDSDLKTIIIGHGFTLTNLSYELDKSSKVFKYSMSIRTKNRKSISALSKTWRTHPSVVDFKLTPA
jgi:putative Mg2+ transporter-C (MgtC) family protein